MQETYAVIARLCSQLKTSAEIIAKLAEILAQHGIITEDGKLEQDAERFLKSVHNEEMISWP